MTTKPTVETCSAGSHFATAVEAGRQAYQADAWQDGRCACFAFGWSEGARSEELAEARQATARTADHWELVDGEWVRQTVDTPSNFIQVPEPKGESDYICGWCAKSVSWSERFVDVFDGNTPYHRICWENRQAGERIAQAMSGELCSGPDCC